MRAPGFAPFKPVEPAKGRFAAAEGAESGRTVGRVMIAAGSEIDQLAAARAAVQAMSEDTAGRARALQDRATLDDLVRDHLARQGSAAVDAQPHMVNQMAKITADGQSALGTPGMHAAYDAHLAPALADAAGRMTEHTLRQAMVERQAVIDREMQAAQQAAAADWHDPARFVQGLDHVQALATRRAASDSGDTSEIGAAAGVRGAIGGAVAGALDHALAAGEPEFAAHILTGWGQTLTPASYQATVARLGQESATQHAASLFAQAAGGGNPANPTDPVASDEQPGMTRVAAPTGAAIHPIAGGTVTQVSGSPDNQTVAVQHPDGSTARYGGLGLSSVAPGMIVVPGHVLGSASPDVTLSVADRTGTPGDAAASLRNAGGPETMICVNDTPRAWDIATMRERIAGQPDVSSAMQAQADNLALRRMNADHAQLAANDLAAGRAIVALHAADPDAVTRAGDLPGAIAARAQPGTLAQIDSALRSAQTAPTPPQPGNPAALRLQMMQRQAPQAFAQVNLAPLIGAIAPAELTGLATDQARMASGAAANTAPDHAGAILDALARHEVVTGSALPDEQLPAIVDHAGTLLRLDRTDPADTAAVKTTVADAIQSSIGSA